MGLRTLMWPGRPMGFFIPHRYAAETEARLPTLTYPHIVQLFERQKREFQKLLTDAADWSGDLERIGGQPPPAPRWDQDWFSGLDAAVAYSIVRQCRPRRIVEIGSGHSTRFFVQAVRDGAMDCMVTAIDPAPRAAIDGLSVTRFAGLVHDAAPGLFEDLRQNDVLSIDSSHILMPGTDVDHVLNHILPTLAPGVLVHFHDVFLPHPYPPDWQWRGYNEQPAVALLVTGGAYRPIFASHYMFKDHRPVLARSPLVPWIDRGGARPSSLWLEKSEM